jgi:hypothetical protein
MNTEKKISIGFERLSTAKEPESLKVSDMAKVRGGWYDRGGRGGAAGADACACACLKPEY